MEIASLIAFPSCLHGLVSSDFVSCLWGTNTGMGGGGCSAAWRRPVSSVNDLWRVSQCVSLGSFRFVSTALYLRAPFVGPQVWPPSPTQRGGGGQFAQKKIPLKSTRAWQHTCWNTCLQMAKKQEFPHCNFFFKIKNIFFVWFGGVWRNLIVKIPPQKKAKSHQYIWNSHPANLCFYENKSFKGRSHPDVKAIRRIEVSPKQSCYFSLNHFSGMDLD